MSLIDVYHGTSSSNTNSILTNGLMPRRDVGNWIKSYQVPSKDGFVYLAKNVCHAEFHGFRTAIKNKSDISILKLTLEDDNLYPDEMFLAGMGKIVTREELFLAQDKIESNKSLWEDSFNQGHVVAHKGIIPVDKIVEHREFPISESVYYGFIKNYDEANLDNFQESFLSHLYILNSVYLDTLKKYINPDETMASELRDWQFFPEDDRIRAEFRGFSITVERLHEQ